MRIGAEPVPEPFVPVGVLHNFAVRTIDVDPALGRIIEDCARQSNAGPIAPTTDRCAAFQVQQPS